MSHYHRPSICKINHTYAGLKHINPFNHWAKPLYVTYISNSDDNRAAELRRAEHRTFSGHKRGFWATLQPRSGWLLRKQRSHRMLQCCSYQRAINWRNSPCSPTLGHCGSARRQNCATQQSRCEKVQESPSLLIPVAAHLAGWQHSEEGLRERTK